MLTFTDALAARGLDEWDTAQAIKRLTAARRRELNAPERLAIPSAADLRDWEKTLSGPALTAAYVAAFERDNNLLPAPALGAVAPTPTFAAQPVKPAKPRPTRQAPVRTRPDTPALRWGYRWAMDQIAAGQAPCPPDTLPPAVWREIHGTAPMAEPAVSELLARAIGSFWDCYDDALAEWAPGEAFAAPRRETWPDAVARMVPELVPVLRDAAEDRGWDAGQVAAAYAFLAGREAAERVFCDRMRA